MKKDGYLYQCMIDSDGRIFNGVWANAKGVPSPLPDGVVVFEEFPSNTNGGNDYIWNGETLVFNPLIKNQEENAVTAEEIDSKT